MAFRDGMPLLCPHCGKYLQCPGMVTTELVGPCRSCGAPIHLKQLLSPVDPESAERTIASLRDWHQGQLPDAESAANEFVASFDWRTSGYYFVSLTGAVMLGGAITLAILDGGHQKVLICLAILLVVFTAAAIFNFVNRKIIRAGQGRLSVHNTVFPWAGGITITAETIRQIYVREKVEFNSDFALFWFDLGTMRPTTPPARLSSGPTIYYELVAVLSGGRECVLDTHHDEDAARVLEVGIERALGIHDRAVSGEHRERDSSALG